MNDRLDMVRQLPLHQYLGIDALSSEAGNGRLAFDASERVINPAGLLHGGVVYTLCDVCAYAGLLSVLADNEEAVTHDIHVSVLRAARQGDRIEIVSELVKRGRSLCFVDVRAEVGGQLIATARVTKSIITR